jgi:cytochrome c oxidase cbb3-type subunit 3
MEKAKIAACILATALTACSDESRPVGPDLPLTPPSGPGDPRIARYLGNPYQVSQGGRYYLWYGCGGCHASGSAAGPDLASGVWRRGSTFDAIYSSIAHGHAGVAYDAQIPAEQLWQISAYVRSLPGLDPQKRRRQDMDTSAEPHDRQGPKIW